MLKPLCLLICIPLLAFTTHKFYVSTTDIEYVAEEQTLQVITRVFIDDMEQLLKTRYSKQLYLGKNFEHQDVDTYLSKYFTKKLSISVNNKTILLDYLGHTYDDDLIKCFFKAKGVPQLQTIEVRNMTLLDVFEDQQNVVHVDNGTTIKSLLLEKDREIDLLNFK